MDCLIPVITVCIWGSLYIASGIVLKEMPALVLLLFRFASSSVILALIGRKTFIRIRREDVRRFLLIGIGGYFLSNAALLLGVQYSSGTLSSLINSTSPVIITALAARMLGEKINRRKVIALIICVAGAMIVIGMPTGTVSVFGICSTVFSTISWAFITIHIRKLTTVYPPLEVTAVGMGIAAVCAVPAALIFVKAAGTVIHWSSSIVFPTLYICLICTALSHCMWNMSLKKFGASYCGQFYTLQPVSSVVLGILLLHENITVPFLIGMFLIIGGMLVSNAKDMENIRFHQITTERVLFHH